MNAHHQKPSEERKTGARPYRILCTYTEGRNRSEAVRSLLRAHL